MHPFDIPRERCTSSENNREREKDEHTQMVVDETYGSGLADHLLRVAVVCVVYLHILPPLGWNRTIS